jgi:thiamine biosynthesis lipoprotein
LSTPSPASKRFGLIIFLLSVLANCGVNRIKEGWQSYTLFFFETVCDVQIFCQAKQIKPTQEEISRIFGEIEDNFSPGHQDLSSPLVVELFQHARQVYLNTGGVFDITVGPLVELWGFSSKAYRVPRAEEVRAVLPLLGMDKIRLEANKIVLRPEMKLDWGGIAKGWAVDRAARALHEIGITRGFINAGGDLFCWGANPDNTDWRVGIQHPRQKGYLGVLSISNTGAATSGDYQRYFERNGVRYCHIFNPTSGNPARGRQSVTVIGPATMLCDALSTALFVSPEPEAILKRYSEYGAIIVNSCGEVVMMGKSLDFVSF